MLLCRAGDCADGVDEFVASHSNASASAPWSRGPADSGWEWNAPARDSVPAATHCPHAATTLREYICNSSSFVTVARCSDTWRKRCGGINPLCKWYCFMTYTTFSCVHHLFDVVSTSVRSHTIELKEGGELYESETTRREAAAAELNVPVFA